MCVCVYVFECLYQFINDIVLIFLFLKGAHEQPNRAEEPTMVSNLFATGPKADLFSSSVYGTLVHGGTLIAVFRHATTSTPR